MAPFQNPRQVRPRGCTGCLTQSALALLLGGAVVYALFVVLAPWNFYFGGHFHLVPGWSGHGWMHSTRAGGDYYLSVSFTPTTPGYRKSPLQGTGFLCTPRGERFRLHFGGSMPRNHGTDLRGVPIHLYLSNSAVFANVTGDRRPQLDLYGSFGNSALILDDQGSLARAFGPDGTLYRRGTNRPWKQESTHVTLEEDSSWIISSSCPSAAK